MDRSFVPGAKAAEITGLNIATLRRYADDGKIECVRTPGGVRRYNIEKYIRDRGNMQTIDPIIDKVSVCYCRVSTYGQSDDLDRQVTYMSEKYPTFLMITDIGSGINFERKGLQKIIDYAITGKLEKLAIGYKDRLCRIGYPLIEYILVKYSNTEIIVDADKHETVNEEIANDLMQIITVYTAKINGMRSYKKTQM